MHQSEWSISIFMEYFPTLSSRFAETKTLLFGDYGWIWMRRIKNSEETSVQAVKFTEFSKDLNQIPLKTNRRANYTQSKSVTPISALTKRKNKIEITLKEKFLQEVSVIDISTFDSTQKQIPIQYLHSINSITTNNIQ